MNKLYQCPRTEICFYYSLYVDATQDNNVGIIEVESIENSDYYTCKAFNLITKMRDSRQLAPAAAKRVEGVMDCLVINQANKSVTKHRPDF